MDLKFLGKGAAFYPEFGNTGAYFSIGKELFLLDCGGSSFEKLCIRLDLPSYENVYVLMTHLHADHAGSLGTMISYYTCLYQQKIHVIHPVDTVKNLLSLEGIEESFYEYHPCLPMNQAGVKAEAVEVHHADNMACFGYLLSDEKECIYYSGDASAIPDLILGDFLEGKIQRVYQDTSSHEEENPSHCYYGWLEAWIPAEKRGQVYCMHLDGPWEALLKGKGFQVVVVEGEYVEEKRTCGFDKADKTAVYGGGQNIQNHTRRCPL